MNGKTTIELIEESQNCPQVITQISNEFLEIESNYNTTLLNLENQRNSIEKKYTIAIDNRKDNHKKEITSERAKWSNGNYVKDIANTVIKELEEKIQKIQIIKWVLTIIGVIILFNGWFYYIGFIPIRWYIAILLIILGQWIPNSIINGIHNKISKIKNILQRGSTFNENDRNELKRISNDLQQKINQKGGWEKTRINNLEKQLEDEFEKFKDSQNKERKLKLGEQERKSTEIINTLNSNNSRKIDKINTILKNQLSSLNQIPEYFDLNLTPWNDESIRKSKELVASNIRIGSELLKINVNNQEHSINVPICKPFLNKSNFSLSYNNSLEAKKAIEISHNVISRVLLSLPANKTKITFIDPLELGGNASPFTPLLREIYSGRVFTQQNDIETELSKLTRAIENVIQRYLQDKFKDIAEYNTKTKEVPEPYRLLVVYNFPHGFNDTISKKLLNIIKSGPKAGVHTIIINDKNAKLPYGINWEMFNGLNIQNIPLSIKNSNQRQLNFDNDLPHSEIVEFINQALPNTSSIKVPFTKYIPKKNDWWKESAASFLSVPIGRHALEIQNLTFNNDDDNQSLLIGKPGSGKSNLLHVIIANSICKYSPEQLEIYLIDFKGGVEFTIYADKKIPHIKTIAIESEREFGLSVLDGVERELLKRENEFSKVGVQNLEQYQKQFTNKRMPRILLIVDEFQEFFTEDDAIKQAVDDKFDRIVRKGRAFGINTLFSSQTLSGNSIKKSTKELIDIRIALMCSDLDANQILDDRNPAAKDLTRPGQGIYNADNGRTEGNQVFQAFFIEKSDLENTINSVVEYTKEQNFDYSKLNQIVFRGSEKAKMNKSNHPLKNISPSLKPSTTKLWLGEPVAITEDVTATFRKEGGSNLLVVGFDENIGVRVICSSIISIATQHIPNTAKFYSFNYLNIDTNISEVPKELFNSIQQEVVIVKNREAKETLKEIKKEIELRIEGKSESENNIYVSLFSFQRGRAFRKDGYSMSEEGNLLSYILKEGSDVGVFALLEINSMDSFSKNLDDNLIKEFSQRVASQMNPENSVKLIGNQKASKLGQNRAIYFDDNENVQLKFKPYEFVPLSEINNFRKPQSKLS